MTRKVIIIGNGPAGIEAARSAALAGAQVTLIGEGPVGGRAGWHSLLPSKVWLSAADALALVNEASELGLSTGGAPSPEPERILARIKAVKQAWNERQEAGLRDLGVEMVRGVATLDSATEITVRDGDGNPVVRLEGDAIIIATGSVPIFPEGMRPDGKRVLAPRFASHLEALPDDIIVIGGGATGSEFAYLFNRLGVQVTWVVDQYGVLPDFVPEAGEFLAEALGRRGVKLVAGQPASRIEQDDEGVRVVTADGEAYRAAQAFLAIGRRADVRRLNVEAVGLKPGRLDALAVDEFMRTAVPSIYAIGDATGTPMLANGAMAEAWVAGRHAAGVPTPPFQPRTVVAAIYTEPQVAQVGTLERDGENSRSIRMPFKAGLKTHFLPGESDGFLELVYEAGNGRLMGGVAVGPHAADVLAPVAVALQMGATISDLAASGPAHPTIGELAFIAARAV